jgi:hypothetical protein
MTKEEQKSIWLARVFKNTEWTEELQKEAEEKFESNYHTI